MAHKKSKPKASRPAKLVAKVLVPKPVTEVVTEETYTTTEPEVEIRKPATLAQALTEPAVAVVKSKTGAPVGGFQLDLLVELSLLARTHAG